MPVEFHCEHCNKVVKAPAEAAGRRGKCPYCGGTCYIPSPEGELEELPLAPLDAQDEKQRKAALTEAAELTRRLLRDRETREAAERGSSASGAEGRSTSAATPGDARKLVADYVEAMGEGRLERAEALVRQMSSIGDAVTQVIDSIVSDELGGQDLPAMPRPVLLGFLRQLRSQL